MERKVVRNRGRRFGAGLVSDRALLAAGAVGLAFVASQAGAQEQEHTVACGCSGCAGDNVGMLDFGEATEAASPDLEAFQVNNRWTFFANGFAFDQGDPVTLTFGVVPDGTDLSDGNGTVQDSSLRSFLDSAIDGGEGVWLPLVQAGYQRWAEVSGVTFVYQDSDDGALSPNSRGILGTRPDLRLGGHPIAGSVIGFNFFPNFGDGVLDTSSTAFFGQSFANFRTLRNTISHEVGHGLGLSHFESNNSNGLMEPSINLSFDGPQHGDILGIQRLYGDALEANGGNDSTSRATRLGQFSGATSQTLSIGTDADDNTPVVNGDETDFISIDGTSDIDVFAFTLSGSNRYDVRIELDPKGPTFNQGPQGGTQSAFNTKALTNLSLELLDGRGNVIAAADANGAGVGELIEQNGLAAGEYFARIRTGSSAADNVQMYRLDVSAVEVVPTPVPEPVVSDFRNAYLAYRGSAFDATGNIATDKQPLTNGQTAELKHYSSYTRGLNRLVIDINDLPNDGADLSADDFIFRVGNDNTSSDWGNAPAPTGVTVQPGAGESGSDRVLIDWADNAIQNRWLQVTIIANEDTALPVNGLLDSGLPNTAAGVQFYYGNARYDSGLPVDQLAAEVTFTDAINAFLNQTLAGQAAITNVYDYNRDGMVNFTDAINAFLNQTTRDTAVQLITPMGPAGAWLPGHEGLIRVALR